MNAKPAMKLFLYRAITILVITIVMFAAAPVSTAFAAACTFTSAGSGNWNAAGTWTAVGGGCSTYPGQTFSGDTVIISSGNTVTLNVSPLQPIASLTFNAAAANNNAVNLNGFTLNVSGAINMTNVPTGNRTTTLAVGTGTLNAGSISIAGSATNNRNVILSVSSGTIHTTGDVTFSGTAAQAQLTVTNTAATLTIDGNFSGGGTFTLANPTNMSLGGDYGFTGTLSNNNRLNLTINGTGDQTINGTTTFRTLVVNKTTGMLFLTSTPTLSNGSTFTNGDVTYNGVAQNVLAANYPDNVILAGTGAKTMPAGTSVTGNLSIAPTGSATASIAAGQNLSVGSLTLGGLGRINGTWGGTGSGATNINTTYFAATTGFLTVGTDTRVAASVTTWPTATGITSGQALSSSTLSGGVASTTGSFAFTTPATIPPVGTYSASVTFTPTDATSYTPAIGAVNVTVSPAVTGTIYYVNNTNASCSNAGTGLTIAQPFCTIGRGVTAAVAGDTVRVLAGTYAETVTMIRSGSAGSPITFSADPGVTVTGAASYGFRVSGRSYITIDGFNVTGTTNIGISVATASDHIIISNNHVTLSGSPANGSTQSGIRIDASTNSTISGNTTDHNSSHGIYISGGSSGNTVNNNTSFANSEGYQRAATGINVVASNNNTIIHNTTYANEDTGIQIYTGSTGNSIIGNVSYGNADHGIDLLNSPTNTIVGNSIQGNYTSGINAEGTSTGVTILNNISIDNGIAIVGSGQPGNIRVDANSTAGSTSNYNIVFLSGAGTSQIQWNGTNYASLAAFRAVYPAQEVNGLQANPLFVAPVTPAVRPNSGNGGLPAVNVGDYHISSTSPAIDSANSNAPSEPTLDIEGNARVDTPIADTGFGVRTYDDRGAYESQTGTGGTMPTVTTEAVTSIGTNTATGNGTITNLGTPNPYQYGVVWDTAANPTIALATKTTQGAVAATGAFTSNITGLTPGTLYHVRAYATNTTGTAYGADVSFAPTSISVGTSGSPSVYGSSVTFTATVLPATATGTVTFYDGATVLGAGTLTSGTATFSTSTLNVSGSPHSITASYAGSGIYGSSTSSAISQTVNPATLTYTADTVSRSYGTANPTFTGTVTGFIAPDTQASATTGTLAFTSTATIASNAGSYPITGSGLTANNGNYIFVQAAGNATALTITPATPTASITNSPVIYNGSVQTATVTCLGGGTATLVSGTGTGANAGSYPATVDCAASLNYAATAGLSAGNFVIDPATPTASITNSPVTYNGSVQTATVSCLGGGTATLVSGTGTGTNAGSYPATVDCAASTNYVAAAGLSAGNFVIDPATPTASITNSPVTYNGSVQTATVACSGGGTATLASGGSGTNAGSYPATVNCAATANYAAAAGLPAGNFVIDPATPTASITNSPVIYNGSVQTASVACLGGGTATLASGGSGTNAGSYPATVDCAASLNYAAATGLLAGNFVIDPATPTASITNSPVIYNGSVQTATVACSDGGTATLVPGTGTGTAAGSYPATVDCAASANYVAAAGLSAGNFVISTGTPTASITNSPVIYNGSVQTATVACSGGGVATLVPGTGTGTNAGSYPATVDCAASANFAAAAGLPAGNFVISPATPTASITNSPVIYNGSVQTATVACLGGGTATLASGGSGTNAGSYPATVDCAASLNYAATAGLPAGNFVINPATPTASITNSPAIYNGSAQTATVACLGGGTATLASGGSGTNVGSYPATVDCAASANYAAATGLPVGNFVIDPATPTASVTNSPVIYNGSVQTATVACTGGGTATLVSGTGSGTDVGSYPAIVDCAASANYVAAAGLSAGNFVITNSIQTITVTTNAPTAAANGSTFSVAATADSGLIVSITASGVCTIVDNGNGTADITMTSGTGTCSVFYDQAGDGNYSAATQVQEDVTATEGPAFTSANNTAFDVTFFGTFTVTAVGNPQTMTISLVGSLPSGVTFTDNGDGTAVLSGIPALGTNGTYPLSFTADNGVLPNGTQALILTVKSGPIIGANGINSIPDTGDGHIGENESIIDTLGITQLKVAFSQDVYNPAGDTDEDDVTNPANYILVRSTSTTFATISCAGGVVAPDVSISVDSVTYSNGGGAGPFVSTLSINGGFPLNIVGFYRLYVCGTTSIVDASNTSLVLAGNGTTPGTDFLRNFRITTTVPNGGGGGEDNSSKSTTEITNGFLIPVTGFAPDRITTLPAQPADAAYTSLGQMTIEIPTLSVKFPIVGANISNKTWNLTWLKDSVAYLEGSAYPTTAGNTVLTAHVQDANKNLGPFSDIKGMTVGQIIYIHVNGQTYVYQVQENSKISSTSITTMFKHEEDSWITLVTCEDFNAKTGLYSSRRMVRAVLISVIPSKK